jgi:CRP/FNR family transcriptional regulator, cyclic AMP receptor protein
MSTSLFSAPRRDVVSVLTEDRELADRLNGSRRERAESASAARQLRRAAGTWHPKDDAGLAREGLGLLVMEGTLVRRVGLGTRLGAELLTAGDLLQPAEHDGEETVVPFEATWQVLAPLRMAVLDLAWMARMAPYPEIFAELTRRVMRRSRRVATLLAIVHHHRLDDRLRLFFWELADRYGRVTPEGVQVQMPLTHDLISQLVGAHRPSVSTALSRLEQAGEISREGHCWTLHGTAPDLLGR